MNERLVLLVFRDSEAKIRERLQAALALPSESDTEAYVVSFAVEDLTASLLDRLAAMIGWEAVMRLNVGAVVGTSEGVRSSSGFITPQGRNEARRSWGKKNSGLLPQPISAPREVDVT